jgi:hypothetical protein
VTDCWRGRAAAARKDEYDDYVGPLISLLRRGAGVKDIYDHLREVETKYMGEDLSDGNSRRAVAYAIEGWYYESMARWADKSAR